MEAESTPKLIVIVDDNPADALFAMQIIKKYRAEYEVMFLDEGTSLLDYINNEANPIPFVVLLDRHMPAMDGMEVLRKLKRIDRAATLPVIMLTSSVYEYDITGSYSLGVTDYIVKPLDANKFLGTLDNVKSNMAAGKNKGK